MNCLLYPGALWQHSHQTNVLLATRLESLHSQRSGISLKGCFRFFQESDLNSYRLVLQVRPAWKRPEDTCLCPVQSPLLTLSIIHKDKVSDTWESNAVCFPLLSQYFDSKCEGGNPRGLCHVKCSFMFCKGTTSSSILHPRNGELSGKSHSVGTVCSDRLTNLTTDWLRKWLSFALLAPSSLSEASVALSFFFLFRAFFPLLFIPTHSHLPQQECKRGY